MTNFFRRFLEGIEAVVEVINDQGEFKVDANFTGDVIVDIDKADKIEVSGSLTLDGSEQQLPDQALKSEVLLKADEDNAAEVWYGDTGVDVDDGVPLAPGESVSVIVDNSNKVYLKGTAADILHYAGG